MKNYFKLGHTSHFLSFVKLWLLYYTYSLMTAKLLSPVNEES